MKSTSNYTLNGLASVARLDKRTVQRRLQKSGIKVAAGTRYRLPDVFAALCATDIDPAHPEAMRAEKLRQTRARADLLELRKARETADLVPMCEAEAMVRSTLLPIREMILSAPVVLAARVNPTDPEHARAQIQSWVDNGLRSVRETIT
jgi:phage terminase Nu1 subunit (DNA packaging protein)